MKEIWNKDIKKYFNDINTQLTLGISSIVFISTLIIAVIFLTQYRQLTLSKTEHELQGKAEQLAEMGKVFIDPINPRPNDLFWESLRNMTGTELWIIESNGEYVLTTSKVVLTNAVMVSNAHYIKDAKATITYDYSTYFKTRTLTAIAPITDGTNVLGIIVLHQNVNNVYSAYSSFNILVFISLLISLIISIILGIIYSSYFTKPIERITEVTDEIRKGNYKVTTGIKRDDQIGQLAKTVDQMSVEIDRNITEIKELEGRAKELVANVSHEFKTPLTLIRGYTLNLKDKTIKPSEEVYNKIINNTVTLEKLVNELLDLNHFQSGQVVLKKEDLDLVLLVNDIVGDMREIARTKKIEIDFTSKEKYIINADYTKMRQLITIFLDNAIKYSNEATKINITIKDGVLKISDHGIGIEKSELEQIFNRYYQVNSSEKGYGLGLCIAKYIADAHGYDLDIQSSKNKGTVIKIKFIS